MFAYLQYAPDKKLPLRTRFTALTPQPFKPWVEVCRINEDILNQLYVRPYPSFRSPLEYRWVRSKPFNAPIHDIPHIAQAYLSDSSLPDVVAHRPSDFPLHIIPAILMASSLVFHTILPRVRLGADIRERWLRTEEGRRRIRLVEEDRFNTSTLAIVELGFNAVGEICTVGAIFYIEPEPVFVRFRLNGSVIVVVLNNRWDGFEYYFQDPQDFLKWIYDLHRPLMK